MGYLSATVGPRARLENNEWLPTQLFGTRVVILLLLYAGMPSDKSFAKGSYQTLANWEHHFPAPRGFRVDEAQGC